MAKPAISLAHGHWQLKGRPFFLYSGEIHYFRLSRRLWSSRLRQAKAAGLNTVGCYIPWIWHEPSEGRTDLTGRTHPQRDLVRFLTLLKQAGLYGFVRIGPICHGEVQNEGLPSWLLDGHPDIRLRTANGTPHPYPPLVTLLHPTYLHYVERWYAALVPVLKRFAVTHGGPLIAVQLDNEISMLNWLSKAPDYQPEVTHRYRSVLAAQYGSIERLNQAYGSAYRDFSALEQPRGDVAHEGWVRCTDWARFYRRYYASYFATLADLVKARGLRLPLVANIPQFYDYQQCGRGLPGLMTTAMFRDFNALTPKTILGGAYQLRQCTFENFHDLWLMNEAVRAISHPDAPVLCAEFQTGGINDRPRIYGSDVELTLICSVGHGLGGLNGYMFSGGVNPKAIGYRSTYHEWQAPIASDGTERPHLEPLRIFGEFLRSCGSALAESSVVYDPGAFGWYLPYYMTEYCSGPDVAQLTVRRDRLFFDGMARLLMLNGFRLPLVDLEAASLRDLRRYPVLVVLGLEVMSRDVQEKLASYAEQGGRLWLMPFLPTQDERRRRETLLQDRLGIALVDRIPPALIRIGTRDVLIEEALAVLKATGGRVLARTEDGKPCAIVKPVGKGRVLVAGFGMPHLFDYHVEVMRHLAAALDWRPRLHMQPWDVPAVERAGRHGRFLFVANPHDDERDCALELREPGGRGTRRVPRRGTVRLPRRSGWIFPVQYPLAPGVLLVQATCQLLTCTTVRGGLIVQLRLPPAGAELVLRSARVLREARFDGQVIPLKRVQGDYLLQFPQTEGRGRIGRCTIQS